MQHFSFMLSLFKQVLNLAKLYAYLVLTHTQVLSEDSISAMISHRSLWSFVELILTSDSRSTFVHRLNITTLIRCTFIYLNLLQRFQSQPFWGASQFSIFCTTISSSSHLLVSLLKTMTVVLWIHRSFLLIELNVLWENRRSYCLRLFFRFHTWLDLKYGLNWIYTDGWGLMVTTTMEIGVWLH